MQCSTNWIQLNMTVLKYASFVTQHCVLTKILIWEYVFVNIHNVIVIENKYNQIYYPLGNLISPISDILSDWELGIFCLFFVVTKQKSPIPNCMYIPNLEFHIPNWGYYTQLEILSVSCLFLPTFCCAKGTIDTNRLWTFCHGKYFGIFLMPIFLCLLYVCSKFMDSLLLI